MALFLEFLLQQWILVAALLVAVSMLLFHETRKAGPALSPQQAIDLVNAEDGIFLDLRDGGEFKQGHIVDAVHIPIDELPQRYRELKQTKRLICVCQAGGRSAAAAEFLTSIGGSEIYNVAGGMSAWSGRRVTGGKLQS